MTFADRVAAAMTRPPLSEVAPSQLDELAELARDAGDIDDLPGKWQAAVLQAEAGVNPASPAPSGCSSCHRQEAAT